LLHIHDFRLAALGEQPGKLFAKVHMTAAREAE
jgi:hypothetical protein